MSRIGDFVVSLVLILGTPWIDQGRSHWWEGLRKKSLMRRFKEEADEKSSWVDGNLIFQVTKIGRTFKSEGTLKFEPLKNKWKFKSLKANELKFVPFKSNFPKRKGISSKVMITFQNLMMKNWKQ